MVSTLLALSRVWWPALIGSILFFLMALLLVPYPGIQEDEVNFAPAIYQPASSIYHVELGGHVIPLMTLSYLGATKTWIYALIFKLWRPSRFSIRVPVILIYASTIWVFYGALRLAHGWRAGMVGALLLATDPIYVLTGSFGWCNLQNVFMLAALGAFLKFHQNKRRMWLAGAMFCTGLWLWDKAVALWILSGLVLAAATLFRRETLSLFNRGNIAVGLTAFCVGGFPLILYNLENDFPTLRANAHFSTVGIGHKLEILKLTGEGSIWLGAVVNHPATQDLRGPESQIEKWTVALHDHVGDHRSDYLPYAFGGSFLLLPVFLVWKRFLAARLLVFSLIVMCVAWLQMALTENAGTGGHHPALLWPFPHLFIAIALAEASYGWTGSSRWLLASAVIILMASNMLTVQQYLYQFVQFGGAGSWSEAIYALSNQLPSFHADKIIVGDWGITYPLLVLHQGELPLQEEEYTFLSVRPSEAAEHEALRAFAEKNSIWVTHAAGNEIFPGVNSRLAKMASAAGYQRIDLGQVRDRNQRPMFDVFRMVASPYH
jgi:hypothetical protein